MRKVPRSCPCRLRARHKKTADMEFSKVEPATVTLKEQLTAADRQINAFEAARTWELLDIAEIRCEWDTGHSTLLRYANRRRAERVVKVWSSPLFMRLNPSFRIVHLDGHHHFESITTIRGLFDLALVPKRSTKTRKTATNNQGDEDED